MRLEKSELLSVSSFSINPSGVSLKEKLPELRGTPFLMSLQKETEYYFAEVYFNYATNWLTLRIKDAQNNIIQGDTNTLEYPYNLLLTPALNDYGLFYFKEQSEFKYYKLSKDWYNSVTMNYWEYKQKMLTKEVF